MAFSAGDQDACVVTLDEFIGRCENCTVEVIMTLVNTLTGVLDDCQGDWRSAMAARLTELLDTADSDDRAP